MEEPYNGALPDERSPEEKKKDWQHEELFGYSTAPVTWEEVKIPDYPVRNQDGSGACGPFSGMVSLGRNEDIENGKFAILDPAFIYQKRANRPAPGMNMIDLFSLMKDHGAPGDREFTADGKNDGMLDSRQYTQAQIEEATKYKGMNYVFIRKDMDTIAQVISAGHTPIILLRCQIDEWTTEPKVLYPEMTSGFNVNHFNPLVAFGTRNGKKVLVSLDSWGSSFGERGFRFIDEDFLMKRVETIGYVIDLPNQKPENKPTYNFGKFLTVGLKKDPDVVALQNILKYEDVMDENIPSTGNYLELTRAAVTALQRKHGIASEEEIIAAKGNARAKTIAWLNANYNA